jgi:hypothetical protein
MTKEGEETGLAVVDAPDRVTVDFDIEELLGGDVTVVDDLSVGSSDSPDRIVAGASWESSYTQTCTWYQCCDDYGPTHPMICPTAAFC